MVEWVLICQDKQLNKGGHYSMHDPMLSHSDKCQTKGKSPFKDAKLCLCFVMQLQNFGVENS